MKKLIKKRLFVAFNLIAAMILLVEFNKYMKRQVPPCEDGSCQLPHDYGHVINPFPEELIPVETATKPTPASGHPSNGGESNNVCPAIPSSGGVREARGGFFPDEATTKELNNE